MTEEKPIYWTPGYAPKDMQTVRVLVTPGIPQMFDTGMCFSSDAGWSQFQRDYPDACPKCKASIGLDINRKCQYCDYDNSPKKCEKCDGSYFGESYTKPLCQKCYDKKRAKEQKAHMRKIQKINEKWKQEQEKERLAWRAEVALNENGEIDVDFDLYDEHEKLITSLTIEQTEDLIEKLERILQDAKKKKSI